jgi:hypothetical protein
VKSFNKFLDQVDTLYINNSFISRYGQTVMNVLQEVFPEKYKEIINTDYDCFYDDGIVRLTLDKLENEWPKGE